MCDLQLNYQLFVYVPNFSTNYSPGKDLKEFDIIFSVAQFVAVMQKSLENGNKIHSETALNTMLEFFLGHLN